MKLDYPSKIKKSVDALCKELEKHYPELFLKIIDSFGNPSNIGVEFHTRMQFFLYLELIKAGIEFNEDDFIVNKN